MGPASGRGSTTGRAERDTGIGANRGRDELACHPERRLGEFGVGLRRPTGGDRQIPAVDECFTDITPQGTGARDFAPWHLDHRGELGVIRPRVERLVDEGRVGPGVELLGDRRHRADVDTLGQRGRAFGDGDEVGRQRSDVELVARRRRVELVVGHSVEQFHDPCGGGAERRPGIVEGGRRLGSGCGVRGRCVHGVVLSWGFGYVDQ